MPGASLKNLYLFYPGRVRTNLVWAWGGLRRNQHMIRLQIVEHQGAGLHRNQLDYMRSGELQTFYSSKRGC